MLDRREAILYTEAQKRLGALNLSTKTEIIPVNEANHRVTSERIAAPYSLPYFRRSGYDGYAIRAADDDGFPKIFHCCGEIPAGATFDGTLGRNDTVQVMTGAFVPENAGKVIMLEQTRPVGGHSSQVEILTTSRQDNITPVGSEFSKGDELIPANTELNPGGLGLLRAFAIDTVSVFCKPRVAVITTGSELLADGSVPVRGKIFNSNGPMIKSLVEENGAAVTDYIQLTDRYEQLINALSAAAAKNDLIVTNGGVSVGDFDFIARAAKASRKLLFNKLRMRPGSVTTAFLADDQPVIALSGNPGACFTGFYLFVEPVLRQLVHQTSRVIKRTALLDKLYKKTNGYDRMLRGVYHTDQGKYYVHLVGSDRSGSLGNLQSTTCLFKIPHSTEPIKLNAEVETWFLPFR